MTAIFRSNSEATRILIVREPSAVELGTSDRLVSIGYGVTVAEGADSALALLRDDPDAFDIVISEVSHDASVGLDFLGWLKSDPQVWNKPVIMLTGGEPDKDHTALLNAGAHFCLNHGVDDEKLRSAVSASVIDGKHTNRIREEVRDWTSGIGRIVAGTFEIRTLDQARKLSTMLSLACPDPQSAAIGLSELMTNAIEHGNLGITYDEKCRLLESNSWFREIDRRLARPENQGKTVTIEFESTDDEFRFRIIDQGPGFDPEPYMEIDPARTVHAHGRGISMAAQFCFDRVDYVGRGNEVVATVSSRVAD